MEETSITTSAENYILNKREFTNDIFDRLQTEYKNNNKWQLTIKKCIKSQQTNTRKVNKNSKLKF